MISFLIRELDRQNSCKLHEKLPLPSMKKKTHWKLLLVASFTIFFSGYGVQALTQDGHALLKFKMGIKGSDGILTRWREDDEDPCHWPGVTCDPLTRGVISLNLPFRKLSGYISPALGNLQQLRRLYLEVNYLSGHILGEVGRLTQLMILDLSSNSLSGRIPESLGSLRKLTIFNVSTNFLCGEIPESGVLKRFTSKSFVGNLGLCGQQVGAICLSQLEGPSTSPDSFSTPVIGFEGAPVAGLRKRSAHYSTEVLVSALGAVGVSLLIALMCFWGCFLYHSFWKKSKVPQVDVAPSALMAPKLVFFHGDLPYTSKEIVRKIELLSEANVIGYGGFGTVYKLIMEDGSVFAVKRLEKHNSSPDRFFERELEILGSIKHRNLVNLRGYCNSPSARLLIYDFLSGGSLDEVLHAFESAPKVESMAPAFETSHAFAFLETGLW